jgi:hypothetical protein
MIIPTVLEVNYHWHEPTTPSNYCMVAHSSDMHDPSWSMIPRHLQNTALPLHPRHYSSIPPGITPDFSLSCLMDINRLVTHSSDMQDLSWCTILRHLQDTALPLSPCHYSYILCCTTPDSSLLCHINTNGLVTAFRHHYCNIGTAPS